MIDTLEKFRRQHIENYKKAILENIKNNTNVLVDEDIMSLLKRPPLDSMDVIKSKFLDLAKKNNVVIDTTSLDNMLNNYRQNVVGCCEKIKTYRIDELSSKVASIQLEKDTDIIKLNKKDFMSINKKLKKIIKDKIKESVEKVIVNNVNSVFTSGVSDDIKKKMSMEVLKFVSGIYQRQLLENIDIKVLVKDTILINSVKEQAERYLFTLENSRIFRQEKD